MNQLRFLSSCLVICLVALGASASRAQEKQTISWKNTANNSRYVQQHVIDAGDVPGHQVRIFEIQWKFPAEGPKINGSRIVESRVWGFSDYTNGIGPNSGYIEYLLEDGSKVYTKSSGVAHTTVGADGKKVSSFFTTESIVGGTGKAANIRGTLKTQGQFDPKAGWLTVEANGEYWVHE
jgi:hypothetical protein